MSADRLRRLDALFAERVLQLTIHEMPMLSIHTGEWTRESMLTVDGASFPLPRYTRSLDAAWEGAMALGKGVDVKSGDSLHCARIGAGPVVFSNHPAEALVLACLRAVGCTEEELK